MQAGWCLVKTKSKDMHEPIVSQELFDAVQAAIEGKSGPPVVYKKLNDDFSLRGLIRCTACDKKLTAGWVKGRKEKYARYWCWNPKCPAKVSASRDEIENAFLRILNMLVPTQEFLNDLPRIAKSHWTHRLERIRNERRRISTILQDVKTLNQKIVMQKVSGELSAEDFAMAKEMVTQQKTDAETQMNALDAENASMETLLQEQQNNVVDLVGAWQRGGIQQRQEIALNLFPEGLRFSQETLFFEPGNVLLMNIMREMNAYLADEKNWSGRRELNPRLRPWQGRTLPLSYSRSNWLSINEGLPAGQTMSSSAARTPEGFCHAILQGLRPLLAYR